MFYAGENMNPTISFTLYLFWEEVEGLLLHNGGVEEKVSAPRPVPPSIEWNYCFGLFSKESCRVPFDKRQTI